jgi:MFS family permease
MNEKPLWKNKDYLILFAGQTVSNLGTAIDQLAFPLLILYFTNSPFMAGVGIMIFALPTFLFGLFAGALVDRLNRKKVMIACDVGRLIATGSIPLLAIFGYLNVYLLFLFAFAEGTFATFFSAAETAALLRVVGKEKLTAAMSQNDASLSAVSTIGPSIGGFVYQFFGKTIPFVVDSISYLGSIISLFFIKSEFQEERIGEQKNLKNEIIEGLVWFWKQPIVRIATLLTTAGAFISGGQNLTILLLAKNLHATPAEIGLIFSVGAIGDILGALMAGRIGKKFSTIQVIIFARWFMAIILPLYLIVNNAAVLGILTAFYYFPGSLYGVLINSYRVSLIPDALQGRIASIYRILIVGAFSLGGLTGGILLQFFGITLTVIIFSLSFLILAILATVALKGKKITNESAVAVV